MLYRPGLLGRMPCAGDWYMPSPPPTVNINFAGGSLPSGTSFSRTSVATDSTYQDSPNQQTYNVLSANTPLINQWGIKVEPASINQFLNSDAPVTQSVVFNTNDYVTIWIVGPGSLTVQSTAGNFLTSALNPFSSGSVVCGTPLTLTCNSSGTLLFTPTGTIYRVQVEKQPYPTSYIVSGASAQLRSDVLMNYSLFGGQMNVQRGTYWVEYMLIGTQKNGTRIFTSGGGSNNNDADMDQLNWDGPNNVVNFVVWSPGSTNAGQVGSADIQAPTGKINRSAFSFGQGRIAICSNYGQTYSNSITAHSSGSRLAATFGYGGTGPKMNGYFRGFRFWPVQMSDQELHECTGPGYYQNAPVMDLDLTQANSLRMWTNPRASGGTGTITDATYDQPTGTAYNTYANNAHRVTSRGTMFDTQRNNYIGNSSSPGSGTVTGNLSVQTHMCWMRGTGTVTFSAGTASVSSATPLPVTITQASGPALITIIGTGNLNWAVSGGTVEMLQLEQVGTPTIQFFGGPSSLIRTTTQSQSRLFDGMVLPIGPWWNKDQGTYYIEVYFPSLASGSFLMSVDNTTTTEREQIFAATSPTNQAVYGGQTIQGANNMGRVDPDVSQQPTSILTWHKMAYAVSSDRKRQFAQDGVMGNSGGLVDALPCPRPTPTQMRIGGNGYGNGPPNCIVRRWRYYDYAIFDDALKALTGTPDLDLDFTAMSALDGTFTFTRTGAAAAFDATGALLTYGANTPRFDYDPITHAPLGLLIENTRTNSLLQSGVFANATWNKGNCTLGTSIAAPDGTTNGAGIISTSGQIGFVSQNYTSAAGALICLSTFLKAGARTQGLLLMPGAFWADGHNCNATFNLTGSGSVAQVNGATASAAIQAVGNGWYRCSLIAAPDQVATAGMQAARDSANGDGTTLQFYAWGAQIEAGSIGATSYIPTTTVAVARGADVCYKALGAWYATVYSMLASYDTKYATSGRVGIGDTVAANAAFFSSSSLIRGSNSAAGDGLVMPGSNKQVGVVGATAIKVCNNGGTVGTDAASAPQTTATRMSIGCRPDALNFQLDGHIKRVTYWARELADAEMQALTK